MRLYKVAEIDRPISGIVPIEDLPQALGRLGGRGTRGKIITLPGRR